MGVRALVRSLLDDPNFRLQFAGHETFPLRYGWLKKAYEATVEDVLAGKLHGSAFSDDSSIAKFGVGRNMVLSIKHWALATGVLHAEEISGERASRITPGLLGDLLFRDALDPDLEHPGSLWLLHWMLASKPGRATAWHWAFNEFHEVAFDRELMRRRLQRRCADLAESGRLKGKSLGEVTIRRDIDCLIRTYSASGGGARRAPEDSIECPLTELGLIQKIGVGEVYRFRRGPKPSLPNEMFLFALVDFWSSFFPGRQSFSVDFLTFERGSPGRVFLLDPDSLAERLVGVDELTQGALRWDESSGMRQVYAHNLQAIDPPTLLRVMLAKGDERLAA